MLYLLFQLGNNRYALEASRVVEVLPLLALQQLPQAPKAVAGIFNYRGRPVAAVDLGALTQGQPASERFSTRIIIVNYPDESGTNHLVGLIAEHVTELLRKDAKEFADPGVKLGAASYLGPILMDGSNSIQLIYEHRLLPEPVRHLLFADQQALCHEIN
jgi:chemotaxis-related protein WspB